MTGCKGYGLRGSDARTEIERTKEADTPGNIPGRSGLQADESWYEAFYHHLRMEMDEYRRLKRSLRVLKSYTDYEEDLYEEAV